ncbi:hypothetical protein QW71_17980 [Paenibacillus sp. IHB B 3415]|nr:hypothetical protein QW71_17980 [Paenibacillus sp. IHB B 3415]
MEQYYCRQSSYIWGFAFFYCIGNYTIQKNVDNSEEKGRGMNMKNQETWKKRGIIRQILKDHFHGFMEMLLFFIV